MIFHTIYAYTGIGRMRCFARKASVALALPLLLAVAPATGLAQTSEPDVQIDLRALESLGGAPDRSENGRVVLHPPGRAESGRSPAAHRAPAKKETSRRETAKSKGKHAAPAKTAKTKSGKTSAKAASTSRTKASASKTAKTEPLETPQAEPVPSSTAAAEPALRPVTPPTAPAVAPPTDVASPPAKTAATEPSAPTPSPKSAATVSPLPAAPSAATAPAPAANPQVAALPSAPSGPIQGGTRITFGAGTADLSDGAKKELDGLAQSLGKDDQKRVQLVAYAGGSADEANQARRLSLSRALNVRAYLIDKGVRNTRMDVRALGNRPDSGGPLDRVDVVLIDR